MPDPGPDQHAFSSPTTTHEFACLLFDMDGTIIDSTNAIVKYWTRLGEEIGMSGDQILQTSHGRRSIDVLALIAPDRANWEYICRVEGAIPKDYGADAVEIQGSRALLDRLQAGGAKWAIVTSGTRLLVGGWLDVMGLAQPEVLVTAEDVERGKPDPACYRLGARRLGFDQGQLDVLVLEDAPAGVKAGKAAGFKVVALATTHGIQQLKDAGADWIVEDMRSVTMKKVDADSGKVVIEIKNALVG
ncbi:Glycerol-1-phosphate phosphohydrolase 1 [Acrodontium crateriforme]|uniref:Glycerol-1-phosphate phosphohydrolase 1 n=1 Tax=Acrodontium crateriforme TaxID=150365 RepID=A0AAQ3R8M8_9PEZI|nr:Glycerol-1-phosphate phosphohydrolase 1 [Acrodontium crateriforme]